MFLEISLFELGSGGLLGTLRVTERVVEHCPHLQQIDFILSDDAYDMRRCGTYELTSEKKKFTMHDERLKCKFSPAM